MPRYRNIWKSKHQSIALINFYSENLIKVNSLSGFKVNDYLITDDSALHMKRYNTVEIRFVQADGNRILARKTLTREDFLSLIISDAEGEDKKDFCVVKIDFREFKEIPSLKLSEESDLSVGQPIITMGYGLSEENLAMKAGHISSFHFKNQNKYIQFDASVKQGNAGSPLIDLETGTVIGVIGHNLTEITQSHKNLEDILNKNIQLLKQYQGRLNIDDIDPVQVLIANQNQVKYIAREIYSMTNVGTGYALPANEINHFFKKNIIMEDAIPSIDALVNF